jgi:hypothetical protein
MTDKPSRKTPSDDRRAITRPLAALVPGLARKAVGKRGFTDARILNEWPRIVGENLAGVTHPDRLTFPRGRKEGGTLHIRAAGPMATELQHLEPVVVDRINAHFGFRAVDAIRILQAPPSARADIRRPNAPRRPPPPPADPAALSDLEARLDAVEDPEMRAILRDLGESVIRRNARNARKGP